MEDLVPTEKTEVPEEAIAISKVNQFLKVIGLTMPLDYLFLDHAMNMHREAIAKNQTISLQFLFQLIIGKDEKDMNFPFSSFLEKISFRYVKPDCEPLEYAEDDRYIVTNFIPSAKWNENIPRPFSDFHLYYMDVLKPMLQQSVEELYALFDTKKGETFFLVFGDRKLHQFLVVLFVHRDLLIVFHVPPFESKVTDLGHVCKWISNEVPTFQRQLTEHACFKLPETNLVLTAKGVELRKQQWKEAFENPDIMDVNDPSDLKPHSIEQDDPCENCSS